MFNGVEAASSISSVKFDVMRFNSSENFQPLTEAARKVACSWFVLTAFQ